ncbi:MAG: ATP-binding protein [Candidatus Hydrogenedentota bacterium]
MNSGILRIGKWLFLALILAITSGAVVLEWMDNTIEAPGFIAGSLLLAVTVLYYTQKGRKAAVVIFSLAGFLIAAHMLVAFSGQGDSALYSVYFIPILIAAGRFGLAGSSVTGIIVTILYATFFLHATEQEIQAELLEETITLMFIALLSGYLVDRLKDEEQRRFAAERQERDRERLAEIGLLAAQVAHEFRNPLQVIEGSAETLAARGWVAEAGRILLADLKEQARRMSILAADFLAYGKPVLRARTFVNLHGLVDQAAIGVGAVVVKNMVAESLGTDADPDALERVFRNLFTNARKSSATRVTVSCSASGGELVVRVSDDGTGIPEDLAPQLFQPFRTGRPGGVGLGLAIARRIVEAHDGRIGIAATSPSGTTMQIVFPSRLSSHGSAS